MIDGMEKECEAIKSNALSFAWYMRGGVSYQDILNMSHSEHAAISKIIEDNMKATGESGLPFF